VLVGCRELGRGTDTARELAAEGLTVVPVLLDVTDVTSVVAVASRVRDEYERLDVLVNNVGALVRASTVRTTSVELRATFDVNVFGVVTAITVLLPLLQRSQAPCIVNVSSRMGSLTLASGGVEFSSDVDLLLAYSVSKAALNMLTIRYAQAFVKDDALAHIKINSATPGYVATDMTDHRPERGVEDGARVVAHLANLAADGPSGGFFNDQGPVPW